MIAIAHFIAISLYLGAAALAAAPLARPVLAPVRGVLVVLALALLAHGTGLALFAWRSDVVPLTGLGPSLSFAGFVLGATLLLVELLAHDVTMTLVAAPLAAISTIVANVIGLVPGRTPQGAQGVWLVAHIALSFIGIAAFGTAAAAGLMYLVERRELRSRNFGMIFRLFPPLATLDRVNHFSAIVGWVGLTLGVVLATTYSVAYHQQNMAQLLWGGMAWLAASGVAAGRVARGWQAQRAAMYSSVAFAAVVLLYVAFRVAQPAAGKFL
ncbi:MAG: cytochrome c biogenesis protein CcsA [Gemmatimonadaceae bacterium]